MGGVADALLGPDGTIISAGADGDLRRWRAADGGALEVTVIGHPLARLALDGTDLIAVSDDPKARYRITSGAVTTEPLPAATGTLCGACAGWQVTSAGPRSSQLRTIAAWRPVRRHRRACRVLSVGE